MQTPETPAATHRLTNRSTESSLGHLPHSILAREVMRLKEAKDAVLRQGGGGTMEQAKALRVEIGQIEQQAQADTVALAQEVSLIETSASAKYAYRLCDGVPELCPLPQRGFHCGALERKRGRDGGRDGWMEGKEQGRWSV